MYWYILGSLSCMAEAYPRIFSGEGKSNGRVFDSQLRLLDSLAQSDMTKSRKSEKVFFLMPCTQWTNRSDVKRKPKKV